MNLGGLEVRNPPAGKEMQEMWVQSLGREDPLEKEVATHSSILACKIPWTEEHSLQSIGSQRVGHDWETNHTHLSIYLLIGFVCKIIHNSG